MLIGLPCETLGVTALFQGYFGKCGGNMICIQSFDRKTPWEDALYKTLSQAEK
jgi:hypothetical protein